jgi:hypothetical protein
VELKGKKIGELVRSILDVGTTRVRRTGVEYVQCKMRHSAGFH